MPAAAIFISYRRDDAAGYARAVGDRLAQAFGADRVFVDVDDIYAGQAFEQVIARAVGEAKVVLVLIGKRWRGETADGTARIDAPHDLVRREVATALAAGARVVPVLLDGAAMPEPASLPEDIRALALRNAIELHNTRFDADMNRLLAAVRESLGEPPTTSGATSATRRWPGLALVVAAGLATIGVARWLQERAPANGAPALGAAPTSAPTSATTSAATPALADVAGTWQAEVVYDWPNARFTERFVFMLDGGRLQGSASFLGVARGIEEGRVDAAGLAFATRSAEVAGDARRETVHRYRGRQVGAELHFVMQTEGASTPHVPVAFSARRAP